MKFNKYQLATGIAVTLSLFFIFILRHISYSANMFIISILLIINTLIFCGEILGINKVKSKWLLPATICMFLGMVLVFLGNYFQHNSIDDKHIIDLLIPIVLFVFIQVSFRFKLSTLNDKEEIERENKRFIVSTVGSMAFVIAMVYSVFI